VIVPTNARPFDEQSTAAVALPGSASSRLDEHQPSGETPGSQPRTTPLPHEPEAPTQQPPELELTPLAPDRIGRYSILGVLGEGGMGVVYLAHDPTLKRTVALKTIKPERSVGVLERERFLREAESAAQLKHPHVVAIHDFGEVDGRPFFTMPLLEGGSLATHLDDYRWGFSVKDANGRTCKLTRRGWTRHQIEERRDQTLTLLEKVCRGV
jgi:serine/threonine-protein kinase